MSKFTAVANFPQPTPKQVVVHADTYFDLCAEMYKAMEPIRYYTQGVNGGINADEEEPYTKDLIWPEAKWKITKNDLR